MEYRNTSDRIEVRISRIDLVTDAGVSALDGGCG